MPDKDQQVYIFFTGPKAKKSRVPFLLDSEMRPITAANSWLRAVANDSASPHTRRAYGYALFDLFSYFAEHRLDWCEINNDTLFEYRDTQDQNISPHTGKPLNRKTINARLVVAGRFYTYAAEQGYIGKNPVSYKRIVIRRPRDSDMLAHLDTGQVVEVPAAYFERVSAPKLKWCPHDEVMRWINSIGVWRDKLIAKLMYSTGMRREEVVNLTVRQLPGRDYVNPAAPEVKFYITGKGPKDRLIYLTKREFIELHDYIRIERAGILRRTKKKHEFIFVRNDGEQLPPHALNYIFRRVSERCGIWITPHMLRHSFSVFRTQVWRSKKISQPEKRLQARLGHSNVATTRKFYDHITDEMQADEALANAAILEEIMRREVDEIQ